MFIEDRKLNTTTEAADSTALEPHTDLTFGNAYVTGTSGLFPDKSFELYVSAHVEHDRLSIAEFSAPDIFRHSPLGDVLNSLKNLSLAGDSQPNYIRFELEADDREFRSPPAKDRVFNEFSTSPKVECRKMSATLNSAIDDRSCSIRARIFRNL